MTTHHPRQFPVILITGTPGTGKTLHSDLLASTSQDTDHPLTHLNIGKIVQEQGFNEGWDEEWQSWVIDEDRLLDYLEEVVNPREAAATTGYIIDHHDPSLFPERWIDLAVVLQAGNEVLHQRLTDRNYPAAKLTENITAEIMQTCLNETRESYAEEIVVELRSDGTEEGDVDANVARMIKWVEGWREDRIKGVHGGEAEAQEDMDEESD